MKENITGILFAVILLLGLSGCDALSPAAKKANAPEPQAGAAAPMPTPAIIFPALNVLDLEKTEAFYVSMLGMKPVLRMGREGDRLREVTLNFAGDLYAPESSLVLNADSARTEPYKFDAFSRIAFRVRDIDAVVERMRAAGHKILSEPRTMPGTSLKLAFVEDPNGARVELIEGMASAQELNAPR